MKERKPVSGENTTLRQKEASLLVSTKDKSDQAQEKMQTWGQGKWRTRQLERNGFPKPSCAGEDDGLSTARREGTPRDCIGEPWGTLTFKKKKKKELIENWKTLASIWQLPPKRQSNLKILVLNSNYYKCWVILPDNARYFRSFINSLQPPQGITLQITVWVC